MIVYTFQLAKWRQCKLRQIPYIDTTVKSGCVQLAPHWDMVLGVKSGELPEKEYTERYYEILDYYFFNDPVFFDDLIRMETVAFGCYCPPGKFCHRLLLVEFLRCIAEVDYRGEIE
jgi:hypothetical protein